MKYLVFGATGNIGSRVARRLLDSGARPFVFVRNAKRARALFGDHVDIHTGDLDKPGPSLAAALGAVLDPPPPLQAAKMKAAVAVTAANRRMDIVDSPPLGAVPSSDRCRPPRLPL